MDRQFALGKAFYDLPLEEKKKYQPDLDSGDYNGYRPAGRRLLSGGVYDKTEVWNMATKDGHITQPIPQLLKDNLEEIETFAKVSWCQANLFLYIYKYTSVHPASSRVDITDPKTSRTSTTKSWIR